MTQSKKRCDLEGCEAPRWKDGLCHRHHRISSQAGGAEIVQQDAAQPTKQPTLNVSDPGWKVARYLAARFSLTGERVLASELVLLLGGLLDGRPTDS